MTTHANRSYNLDFLDEILPSGQVSYEESKREQFAEDASPHDPSTPDAVAWPTRTEQVSELLPAANERGIPVTPWSGGTSLEGNPIPVEGGIVLNTYDMEDIEVRREDLQAVVGPGVVYDDLNEELAQYGLRFAPGISSGDVATIGGMVANNASGFNTVRYGETRDKVLRLEVVLPDGRIVEFGRDVKKTSAGYSLKDLVIGSEGTLGVVTEATLELDGIPEYKYAAIITFPTNTDASRAVSEVIQFGLEPGAIEFLDEQAIRLINDYSPDVSLPEQPTLIVELHANNSGIEEDVEFVRGICEDNDADRWEAASEDDMDDVWQARRDSVAAQRTYRDDWDIAVLGDVVVPISRYPEIVEAVETASEELSVLTPCVGHAGDGNLHYTPIVDTDDEESVERAMELNDRLIEKAIELGGTATGEHGIGIGKRKHLETEHGPAVDVMRSIKETLDPNGIMNPGKVLPESDE